MSALLSLGTDREYRRLALRKAGLKPGMRVLDVATGTGLVAQAALDLGIAPGRLVILATIAICHVPVKPSSNLYRIAY